KMSSPRSVTFASSGSVMAGSSVSRLNASGGSGARLFRLERRLEVGVGSSLRSSLRMRDSASGRTSGWSSDGSSSGLPSSSSRCGSIRF
ncbi:hypothetical protein GNI_224330, partial [Gregarina niphandrodes]